MPSTTATSASGSLLTIADELDAALDHAERTAQISIGGYIELPALASKVDRIASDIAAIELVVPDEHCEPLDLDLVQVRSDMRRLASSLQAAANSSIR